MRGNPVRKPVLYVAGVAAVAAVAILIWFFASGLHQGDFVGDEDRTNILYIAEGVDGNPEEFVLLSLSQANTSALFLPPDLWIKGPDGSLGDLATIAERDGEEACCDVVETLLGVEVLYYAAWSEEEIRSLLDAAAPLQIDVPSRVVYAPSGPDAGGEIEIQPGAQSLTADEALAYLRGTSDEETPFERQERVFRAIMQTAGAGGTKGELAQVARSIVDAGSSNLQASQAADVWCVLTQCADGLLSFAQIPSREIIREGETRRVPMIVETERLVSSMVRGMDLLTPDEVHVAVFNGNGVRLMASKVASYLRARGFEVTRIANADSFSYSTSYVVILSEEPKAWVLRDSLPGPVSIVLPGGFEPHYEALAQLVPTGTDVILVVGAGMEID